MACKVKTKKTKKVDGRFCEGCDRCHDCGKPKAEHLMCPRERPQPVWVYPYWNYPWWNPVVYTPTTTPNALTWGTVTTTTSGTAPNTTTYALLTAGSVNNSGGH